MPTDIIKSKKTHVNSQRKNRTVLAVPVYRCLESLNKNSHLLAETVFREVFLEKKSQYWYGKTEQEESDVNSSIASDIVVLVRLFVCHRI